MGLKSIMDKPGRSLLTTRVEVIHEVNIEVQELSRELMLNRALLMSKNKRQLRLVGYCESEYFKARRG